MADMTVAAHEDPGTKGKRHVVGDLRFISGTLTQPQAKYVTGGFVVTPADLGFDKYIDSLIPMSMDKEGKAAVVAERVSDTEWKIKFFSAIGTQLASESETMKEKPVQFIALGE